MSWTDHCPVLVNEVIECLRNVVIKRMFDGTCGAGGHALAVLAAHEEIEEYVAGDQDPVAIQKAAAVLQPYANKIIFHRGNFSEPPSGVFDAILLDIGVSSMQLDTPERGFSFMRDGPLDMRMDPDGDVTAADIVNRWDRCSLERLFLELGEERNARKVVEAILFQRRKNPITTTRALAAVVEGVIPRYGKIHPATKVFQALRLAVNKELDVLKEAIGVLSHQLSPHGRLLIITFHSLEDRIVKQEFRSLALAGGFDVVTKKPIPPSKEEMRKNPRARSAKLRVLERLAKND